MQARQIMLDSQKLYLLRKIILDTDYWITLRMNGSGVPGGVAEITKVVLKTKEFDIELADQLAVFAQKRLDNKDKDRQGTTDALYRLLVNLVNQGSADVVNTYFNALTADYFSYQNLVESGVDVKHECMKGDHTLWPNAQKYIVLEESNRKDGTGRLIVNNIHMTIPDRVRKLLAACTPLKLTADFGQKSMSAVSSAYKNLGRKEVDAMFHEPVRRAIILYYNAQYPKLVTSLTNYIEKLYVNHEELFLYDCSSSEKLYNLLNAMSDPLLQVTCKTKDGIEITAALDTPDDIVGRLKCVSNAILSDKYFTKIFKDMDKLEKFIAKFTDQMLGSYIREKFRDAFLKDFQNKLSQSNTFNLCIKTDEDIARAEKLFPGLPRAAELRKNASVMMLARLRAGTVFAMLPRDVVKMIAVRTVPPIPKPPKPGSNE